MSRRVHILIKDGVNPSAMVVAGMVVGPKGQEDAGQKYPQLHKRLITHPEHKVRQAPGAGQEWIWKNYPLSFHSPSLSEYKFTEIP